MANDKSRIKDSKESRIQELEALYLLREERGRRAKAADGTADTARAEPDPAVEEAEARSPAEGIAPVIGKLVAGTIHVQLFVANEPFGMDQDDGSDCETGQTELGGRENFASTTDALSPMKHAELAGHDQDVAFLLFGDHVERVSGASVNPQLGRPDLTFTPVVERTGLLDLLVDQLDRAAILLGGVDDFGEEFGDQCRASPVSKVGASRRT